MSVPCTQAIKEWARKAAGIHYVRYMPTISVRNTSGFGEVVLTLPHYLAAIGAIQWANADNFAQRRSVKRPTMYIPLKISRVEILVLP